MAAAALSTAYASKALFIIWNRPRTIGEKHYDTEQRGTRRIGMWQQIPLVVLAAGAALLGVLSVPPVRDWLSATLQTDPQSRPGTIELVGSALLALAVVGLVAWKRVPQPSWAANWLGLEKLTRVVVIDPVLILSTKLARFDDAVLDRAVHSVAHAAARYARRLGSFDDRRLDAVVTVTARRGIRAASATARADTDGFDAAVEATARATRRLGVAARRPQTGLLHQYYAQIVVILAIAVVLLVPIPVVR